MAIDRAEYWPFPVVPEDRRTDRHRSEIRFFEAAYAEGLRPCKLMDTEFGASCVDRQTLISWRGRGTDGPEGRWVVELYDTQGRAAAFWVTRFECGTSAVFAWLRGESAESALAAAGDSVIRGGLDATPAGAAG